MTPFLLRRTADPDWSPGRRAVYWFWQIFWVAASGVGLGLVSLLLAVGSYSVQLAKGYLETPLLLLMNLILPVALALLLYGLLRRAALSYAIVAAVVVLGSLGNYYKISFRDDPVMFADLFVLKEAGNMAGNYHLFLDWRIELALACTAAGFVFLLLFVRGRPQRGGRIAGVLALAGITAAALFFHASQDNALYDRAAHYDRLNNRWAATQQYIAHGFLYPFFHSISEAFEPAPEGYDRSVAAAMAAAYEDADIPEDKKVNVVAIMLEAFQDFSRFGTPELTYDVYAPYHQLEAESVSGDLLTNIFAGGTVDSERCFLTGYSRLPNFRSSVNAYPWYFRSQGYQVTGMHPCFEWFYNRKNINQYLGFQDYQFVENYFAPYTDGWVAYDNTFFPMLQADLLARQTGEPIFSFSVTYQGHGPYDSDPCWWGDVSDFIPESDRYTPEQRCVLANYFGSVDNTIGHLVRLRDLLAEQEEPYILILFGDHNPWLGDGNSIYTAIGLDLNQSTPEGFANYYGTRYLIWANAPAKEALGNDFVGEGPTVSPCFLMNEVFRLCGWEGPAYLQSTQAVSRAVPVQHTTGVYLEDGQLTRTLSPEGEALTRDYNWLQYYERRHFRYSGVKGKE